MRDRDEANDPGIAGSFPGVPGLLVAVGAALVAIFLWQSLASPGSVTSDGLVGDVSVDVSQDSVSQPGVSVTRPELVVNSDGSATLSAALTATSGEEVALLGVQILYQGSVQEVSSTSMDLPVVPGADATVGAASDAGGFSVPSGLTAGDVASVQFVFSDQTCVSVNANVVQRADRHQLVFPKRAASLGFAGKPHDRVTSTCSSAVTNSGAAQGA